MKKPNRSFLLLGLKIFFAIALIVVMSLVADVAQSEEKAKVQKVDFDAASIDGTVRNPDGAYLLQKRGIRFLPLYKVRKQFEEKMKESPEYLR